MEITDRTFGTSTVESTTKVMEKQIILTFRDGPEMDIVTLILHWEDRDGENWFEGVAIDGSLADVIKDRSDIATDVLSFLNESINDRTKCFSDNFMPTQAMHNYIDNVIEEAFKKLDMKEVD